MLSNQRRNIQRDCRESLEILLDIKMIANLPKPLLGGFTDDLVDFFPVALFKSTPAMVLKNVISGGLNELFCIINESMD